MLRSWENELWTPIEKKKDKKTDQEFCLGA